MEKEDSLVIKTIVVSPKNLEVCRYWLNGGRETHARKRSSLLVYLTELEPTLARRFSELLFKDLDTSFAIIRDENETEVILLKRNLDWDTASARIQTTMKNELSSFSTIEKQRKNPRELILNAHREIMRLYR